MNDRLHDIVRRRHALAARAAEQRGELAVHAADLRRSLALADLVWRGYVHLRSRPLGVALAAAALVAVGPGRLLRVGYRSGLLLVAVVRLLRFIRALR
ncbi:MAG TPA: YqjK family protein [Burkholderiales bacterium]|nr:YqjK family protein [Burkholderiales bacterium]